MTALKKSISMIMSVAILFTMATTVCTNANAEGAEPTVTWLSKDYSFGYAREFANGLLAVGLDGKWGFINAAGEEVIAPQYDEVKKFSEGLAAVRVGEGWGFIDTAGNVVVPIKYQNSHNVGVTPYQFSNGLANVGTAGIYGHNINIGYIDTKGNVVVPLKYSNADPFSEGLAAVCQDGKWGYINTSGELVIPLKYEYARYFNNGLAVIKLNGHLDQTLSSALSCPSFSIEDIEVEEFEMIKKTKGLGSVYWNESRNCFQAAFYIMENGEKKRKILSAKSQDEHQARSSTFLTV